MKTERIDKISSLPDDLLLEILSSLSVNEVVATRFLSKRWRFLWKRMTKLNCDAINFSCDHTHVHHFVSKSLRLLNSNGFFLQSVHLKLTPGSRLDNYIDSLANCFYVRELRIETAYAYLELPKSLYNTRWTLETLILERLSLSSMWFTQDGLRLPFLKALHLLSVKFSHEESVQALLSSCPVLEDLVLRLTSYVGVMIYHINVPTLKSLSIDYSRAVYKPVGLCGGFVINSPSLRYLNIRDYFSNVLRFEHLPRLLKANVEVACDQSDNILRSLTSVRYLSLCSKTSKILYPTSTSIFSLEHVELCTCSPVWWNLLSYILKYAPRLQVLKLKLVKHHVRYSTDRMDRWNQPCSVPECLPSHLEIFEWRPFNGTKQEKKVAKYILKNANCLKTATFSSLSTKKKRAFKKMEYLARGSEACHLVFH